MKNCTDLNLGDDLKVFISLHFLDSRLYLLNGVDFNFDTVTLTVNGDAPFLFKFLFFFSQTSSQETRKLFSTTRLALPKNFLSRKATLSVFSSVSILTGGTAP